MILTEPRRHRFHSLETANVPRPACERLAALGITTVEELRDHWAYGDRGLLTQYLGESPLGFFPGGSPPDPAARGSGRHGGAGADPLDLSRARPLVRHPRGIPRAAPEAAAVAQAPAARPTAPPRPARVLPGVSLISRFPTVRDQGERGASVAFASAAFLEFHLRAAGAATGRQLSEQFLYWACKARDRTPHVEGASVSTAAAVLEQVGVCLGKTWKYVPDRVVGNEGQGPPPPEAEPEARNYRWSWGVTLTAREPGRLCDTLDAGRPVVLSVTTFPSWDYPTTHDTGEVLLPLPGEKNDGGQAICVVGYQLDTDVPGGGMFLFRNSWGRAWGKAGSGMPPGYGTLFFEYVAQYGLEAFA